jgi:hypothetical protein
MTANSSCSTEGYLADFRRSCMCRKVPRASRMEASHEHQRRFKNGILDESEERHPKAAKYSPTSGALGGQRGPCLS